MCAERGPARTTALAAIGAGGVVGTLLRAGAGALRPEAAGRVPTTTLAVNLVGALVLGLLLGLFARREAAAGRPRVLRLALGTGVMGALTTHSTLMVQAARLLRGGHAAAGAGYLLVSAAAGIALAAAGLAVGARLGRAPGRTGRTP
ncbi:CrcB family protein [uncultured Actinomyces sp.]|uniref:FluC/FEX family fluoride channel n=1 Tax=uncultured Actinomyces sp. TaxID=249061 RepID=UPI00288992D3|nr:CrcB family protein [uncultured Actinomyces sp.]